MTNVTSFLGAHVCLQLLNTGYKVRGTVPQFENNELMKELYEVTAEFGDKFTIVQADLKDINSMESAFTDSECVIFIEPQKSIKINGMKADALSGYRSKLLNNARILKDRIEEMKAKADQWRVLKACQ